MTTRPNVYVRLSPTPGEADGPPTLGDPPPTVAELMTPDPISVNESASLDEAVRLLEENEVSGLPVVDRDGLLVGCHQRRPTSCAPARCSTCGIAGRACTYVI